MFGFKWMSIIMVHYIRDNKSTFVIKLIGILNHFVSLYFSTYLYTLHIYHSYSTQQVHQNAKVVKRAVAHLSIQPNDMQDRLAQGQQSLRPTAFKIYIHIHNSKRGIERNAHHSRFALHTRCSNFVVGPISAYSFTRIT